MADNLIEMNPGWTPASVLVNSTGDAMDNIWSLEVLWPWGEESDSRLKAAVSYRIEGDVAIPSPQEVVYDVEWMGVKVKKIASGQGLDRKLNLNFRLDANYELYQRWQAWHKIVKDVNTGGMSNSASALGTLKIYAPGAEYNALSWTPATKNDDSANLLSAALPGVTKLVWTLSDVQVTNVTQPKFKNGAQGAKQTYTVSYIFGDVAYPFLGTPGANNTHPFRG